MKCRKCGVELHPDQKVCIQCGTPTPAGGGFDYGEEKRWQPTRNHMYIAAGVVLLIIIILFARAQRTVPPDVVAKEWFDAMAGRQLRHAESLVTPQMQQELVSRSWSLQAISDEYVSQITDNQATYEVGKAQLSSPNSAQVTVTMKYAGTDGGRDIVIQLVKDGRRWRVNSVT